MALLTHDGYQRIAAGLRFQTKALINGKFVDSQSGEAFVTENPASGSPIAEVTSCSGHDVDTAIAAAGRAFEERRRAGLRLAARKDSQ